MVLARSGSFELVVIIGKSPFSCNRVVEKLILRQFLFHRNWQLKRCYQSELRNFQATLILAISTE
ncbi:hypothetical protein LEP1GSC062_3360 [Leptospira alexanderi serovar Manhao 3 str. L 60]|uniref:Uncharacterized protein n=1 Tax=Leptospira alexanderi serovar Manhao 3 str. L 60 TaxID=1049759 RepID=V6HYQ3_9LEPT|nr:hypothetical protein LEP1GSC062_3360 [Leptospira alexanderi serovar Manhao 3 str. L 60]